MGYKNTKFFIKIPIIRTDITYNVYKRGSNRQKTKRLLQKLVDFHKKEKY